MLVELGVAEQRHRAVLEVLEVLDGAPVTVVARRYGCPGRRCTGGWAGMPARVGWPTWSIGRPGRGRVRIRCRRRPRCG